MKVTYLCSAAVLIEHGGKRILCDPWLTDGAYYGSWYHFPPIDPSVIESLKDVDAIYLSHIHPDHFDPATLAHFDKDTPIIICEYAEKYFLNNIKRLGFTDVLEVPNRRSVEFAPDFEMEIMAGDDNNPVSFATNYQTRAIPGNLTRQIDSMAIFRAGREVLINSNDVPVGLIRVAFPYIIQKYGEITCLLVSYAGAGPYPQSYDFDKDTMAANAAGAAIQYLGGTAQYIQLLRPTYYIPFAGQYVLGGKEAWKNQFKGTLELDELAQHLEPIVKNQSAHSKMVVLDHNGSLDLSSGLVNGAFSGTDFKARKAYINDALAKIPLTYEKEPEPTDEWIAERIPVAYANMVRKQKEFHYYNPWTVYLELGGGQYWRIPFDLSGPKLVGLDEVKGPGMVATMDRRLLGLMLRRGANWNNAEVGSHILIHILITPPHPGYEPMVFFLMPYFQGEKQ